MWQVVVHAGGHALVWCHDGTYPLISLLLVTMGHVYLCVVCPLLLPADGIACSEVTAEIMADK